MTLGSAVRCEVMIIWGDSHVQHVAHVTPEQGFVLGEARRGSAAIDYVVSAASLGSHHHALLEPDGAWGCVRLPALGSARTWSASTPARTLQPGECIALQPDTIVELRQGALRIVVRSVRAGQAPPAPAVQWRGPLPRWVLASAAFHCLFLVLMYFMPPSASAISMDREYEDFRAAYEQYAPDVEDPPPDWADTEGPGTQSSEPTPKTAQPESAGRPSPRGPRNTVKKGQPPPRSREQWRSMVRNTHFLRSIEAMGEQLEDGIGWGGWEVGEAEQAMNALHDGELGAGLFPGLDSPHPGRGPQRDVVGARRVGPLRTGSEGTPGITGTGTLRRRGRPVPRLRLCQGTGNCEATVRGSLSKEAIRRVIRRNRAQVRACFESALRRNPELEGRLTTRFVIGPQGAVVAAAAVSEDLRDARLTHCVERAVKRWPFPAPDGGGVVTVSYPFLFHAQ